MNLNYPGYLFGRRVNLKKKCEPNPKPPLPPENHP